MNTTHIDGYITRMVKGVPKYIDTFPWTGLVSPSPIAKDRGWSINVDHEDVDR